MPFVMGPDGGVNTGVETCAGKYAAVATGLLLYPSATPSAFIVMLPLGVNGLKYSGELVVGVAPLVVK